MARGRPARATVYARLDAAIVELRERLGGLPSPKESEFIWSDIWHLAGVPKMMGIHGLDRWHRRRSGH